jgi:hypothetical protein
LQYLTIEVTDTIGDLIVQMPNGSKKTFGPLEDVLDHFAAALGWQFVAVLPRLWRRDQISGLELAAFSLIFQRGAPVPQD